MKFELNDKKLDAIKADFELVFIQDKNLRIFKYFFKLENRLSVKTQNKYI